MPQPLQCWVDERLDSLCEFKTQVNDLKGCRKLDKKLFPNVLAGLTATESAIPTGSTHATNVKSVWKFHNQQQDSEKHALVQSLSSNALLAYKKVERLAKCIDEYYKAQDCVEKIRESMGAKESSLRISLANYRGETDPKITTTATVNKSLTTASHKKRAVIVEKVVLVQKPSLQTVEQFEYEAKFLRNLVERTKEHPMYSERYERQLARCKPLCNDNVPSESHPVLAIDCEMVETVDDNMALARVSAVGFNGETVADYLVKPCHVDFIMDCRTFVTGITKHDLRHRGIELQLARRKFQSLMSQDTILVGHALEHDLLALGLCHPHVIDSALLYPVASAPPKQSHALDYLTETVLETSMDRSGGVHSSVEDAKCALDLVRHLIDVTGGEKVHDPIQARSSAVRRSFNKLGRETGFAASLRYRQYHAAAVLQSGKRRAIDGNLINNNGSGNGKVNKPTIRATASSSSCDTVLPSKFAPAFAASMESMARASAQAAVSRSSNSRKKNKLKALFRKR